MYEFFRGLEYSDEHNGCVAGVYRLADLRPFPVLVNAVLSPEWERRPLHQQIAHLWQMR